MAKKKPKLYISGKFGHKLAEDTIKDLKGKGYKLTLNWLLLDVKTPYSKHIEANSEPAEAMIEAVQRCDAFVLIGHQKLYGAMVELGVALSENIPVYLLEHYNARDSVFLCHPNVKRVTYKELVEELSSLD